MYSGTLSRYCMLLLHHDHHATSRYIQPCATGLSMSPGQLRSRSSTSLFFSLWKISSAIAPGKKQTLSEHSEHKWQNEAKRLRSHESDGERWRKMEKDGERWKNGTQMALTIFDKWLATAVQAANDPSWALCGEE